jgi:hypothetical protein
MNTTTFYRIQNATGAGPYRSNCLVVAGFTMDKWTGPRHPSPLQDSELTKNFKLKYIRDTGYSMDLRPFLFGFSSIAQLRAWFFDDDVLKYLHEKGFTLVESNCEIVAGNSQAMASKNSFEFSDKKESSLLSLLEEKKG